MENLLSQTIEDIDTDICSSLDITIVTSEISEKMDEKNSKKKPNTIVIKKQENDRNVNISVNWLLPMDKETRDRVSVFNDRDVSKWICNISACIFLLRLCRNCFYTCGFATQKHIFAAVPQN
jgi:hypothetical protein